MARSTPPVGTALGSASFPHRLYHTELTEVLYVHPDGSDSSDGLTWGTAKETILAAYDALPAGGVIKFADNSNIGGEVADQGLWLAGALDPNYSSLPTGWRQAKPVSIIGVGQRGAGYFDGQPRINGGSTTDTSKPALWTSGGMQNLYIENANFGTRAQPFLLGKASTGSDGTNNSGAYFRNVAGRVNQVAGLGPVWHIYSAYWCWWEHCSTSSNEQELYTSDKRAGFLIRGESIGAGLLWISDHQFAGGGGVVYHGAGGVQMVIERCVQEGVTTGGQIEAPVVWVPDTIGTSAGNLIIRNIEASDSVGTEPGVRISETSNIDPTSIIVQGVNRVLGPCTVLQPYPGGVAQMPPPASSNQVGIMGKRLAGEHLPSRTAFSPALARYTNRAPQSAASWTAGTTTITTGQTGPDGLTNAAKVEAASFDAATVVNTGQTLAVGDWVIGGVWARAAVAGATPGALSLGSVNTNNILINTGTNTVHGNLTFKGTEWEWLSAGGKFSTIGTAASAINLVVRADASKTMYYCYPILFHISSGAITDDEGWELIAGLAPWSDTASAGQVSLSNGESLHLRAGYIEAIEIADPAAPAANRSRLYTRDNGAGKTQLVVVFPTGAVQVLATEP